MSNRDSITSTTSRFSSLLTSSGATISSRPSSVIGGGGFPSSSSSSTSSHSPAAYPTTTTSTIQSSNVVSGSGGSLSLHPDSSTSTTTTTIGGGGGGGLRGKRESLIYERPLTRSRGTEISLTSWNFLFGEIIQYTQKQVIGISEFEKKLNVLGYRVGMRLIELLSIRDSLYPIHTSTLSRSPPPPSRNLRLLPLLTYIHSNLYRYLFGKVADSLERSTENQDEYMIGDDEMLITKNVEVPKEMKELSCAALVAGIIEAVMDGNGFPARVTAHSVPTEQFPKRTVLLIKLDQRVLEREQALSAPTK
ncbi:hypothetical protein JCM3765_003071 [Sporobolomyces pararoseus]